ncbi:putative Ig domain-containing protein [bacterium]|nr:putative Ig domain-containing protein [bacterium]
MKIYIRNVIVSLSLFLSSLSFAQTCADLNGAYVLAQDANNTYLGFFGSQFASESINNTFGSYGSQFSLTSVRNTFSSYGSQFSVFSANNNFANSPPIIYKGLTALAYLTTNSFQNPGLSLALIDASCSFTATAPVIGPTNSAAIFSNATYYGDLSIGSVLSANIQVYDANGTGNLNAGSGLYAFLVANSDGTIYDVIFSPVTNPTLLITNDFAGKTISFALTFDDDIGGNETSPYYLAGVVPTLTINRAPVITSQPLTSAIEDVYYSYDFSVNDPDGDALSFTGSGPNWLSFTGSSLTGTPLQEHVGAWPVTFTLTDPDGLSDTQSFTLTVVNTNDAPTITSSPGQQVTEGQSYSYVIAFIDPDLNDGYDLNVTFPDWLNFDESTDTLFGTPNYENIGIYQVQIILTDTEGLFDAQNFNLEVIDDPTLPNEDAYEVPAIGGIGLFVMFSSLIGLGLLKRKKE